MRVGDLRKVLDGLDDTVELAVRSGRASFPRAVREVEHDPVQRYRRKGPLWVGSNHLAQGALLLVFKEEEGEG